MQRNQHDELEDDDVPSTLRAKAQRRERRRRHRPRSGEQREGFPDPSPRVVKKALARRS